MTSPANMSIASDSAADRLSATLDLSVRGCIGARRVSAERSGPGPWHSAPEALDLKRKILHLMRVNMWKPAQASRCAFLYLTDGRRERRMVDPDIVSFLNNE